MGLNWRLGQGPHVARDPFVRGLEVVMAAKGERPAPLSTRAGLGISAVRDLFRKDVSPKLATARALALELGMTVEEVIAAGELGQLARVEEVPIVGRVGAGAQVPLVDAYQKGDAHFWVATPPQLRPRRKDLLAVQVEGDSMVPVYEPGDLLFFWRDADGVRATDVNHACIVADAEDRAWVKQVRLGSEPGLYHLISLNPQAQTIFDQPVRWATRVRFALPAEHVRPIYRTARDQ